MKSFRWLLLTASSFLPFLGSAQVLYIPNGSSGIGTASTENGGIVGILTGAPAAALHVSGSNQELRFDYNGSSAYYGSLRWAGLQLGNNGANRLVAGRTNPGGAFEFWVNNTNDAADYNVSPDGIFALGIASSGYVGVGTIAPDRALTVAAADTSNQIGTSIAGLHIVNTNAGAVGRTAELAFGGRLPSSMPFATISSYLIADTNYQQAGHLLFSTKENTASNYPIERMRIQNNGLVGIGTPNPSDLLEVSGPAGTTPRIRLTQYSQGTWSLSELANTNSFTISQGAGAGIPYLTIQGGAPSAGFIGIGTENPLRRLHLYEPNGYCELLWEAGSVATGDVGRLWRWGTSPNRVFAVQSANSDLSQVTSVLEFSAEGNAGFGVPPSSSHRVAVNGSIRAKEVIVDTGWADHVFADDYSLMPLEAVEEHIQEAKRLPGIPSADEVAEQGISIGEMQAKLLEKIEELTLHVIAQEKRIHRLEQENTELRGRNPSLR